MQGAMELREFYSQTLVQNPWFFRRLADYYQNFVYNIPKRLFPAEGVELYDSIMQCSNLALHKDYFNESLGISSVDHEDFSQIPARIALLPREHLYHLALMAGMSLCREDIAKVVSRSEVEKIQALESMLPPLEQAKHPNLYTFSLQKTLMYKGHSDHVLINVKGDTFTNIFENLPLDERIVAWGLWSILSCVQLGGQNLVLRTLVSLDELCVYVAKIQTFSQHMLKLPSYDAGQFLPLSSASLSHKEALAWPLLRVLLFKEITCPWEEGWTTFFA